MKVVRHTDADFAYKLDELSAPSSLFDAAIEERTRTILMDVQDRGDAALIDLTQRFDGALLREDQLAVTQAELLTAWSHLRHRRHRTPAGGDRTSAEGAS